MLQFYFLRLLGQTPNSVSGEGGGAEALSEFIVPSNTTHKKKKVRIHMQIIEATETCQVTPPITF